MISLLVKLKNKFPRGSFARNVWILAGGTALGQAMTILTAPILTRLYTPGDFGVLAVYASLLGIVVVAASLRYEMAVPLPEDNLTAISALIVAMICVGITTAITGLIIWFFSDMILTVASLSSLHPYLWLLPLGVFVLGSYNVLNYWAIRQKTYADIARTKLNQGIGTVVTQLALGLLSFGPLGLLFGQVMGHAAGVRLLARGFWQTRYKPLRQVTPNVIISAAKRYRRFPLFATWGALLNSSSLHLPAIILTALYGPQVAGWFFFTQRVLKTPLSLIGQSVSQVYYGEASRLAAADPKRLLPLFKKTASRLFLAATVPFAVLAMIGTWLFGFVFGEGWRVAGTYAQLLVPFFVAQFTVTPISQTFSLLERQELLLVVNLIKLLLVVTPLGLAYYFQLPATAAIGAFSLSMAIYYAMIYIVSLKLLRHKAVTRQAEEREMQ